MPDADTDAMEWTKVKALNSDGGVECEDGYAFSGKIDHEGTFIIFDGLKAYLSIGQTICHP